MIEEQTGGHDAMLDNMLQYSPFISIVYPRLAASIEACSFPNILGILASSTPIAAHLSCRASCIEQVSRIDLRSSGNAVFTIRSTSS